MGNLREVLTAHLVAEALRSQGHEVVHLHSWDDYDRLRKVPEGFDRSFEAYVGMPLSAVPDPYGELDSWASRYIQEFDEALSELGIETTAVRQSERYPAGAYNLQIRRAMDARATIFDVLASYQTAGRHQVPVEERRARYYPFQPYCESCGTDANRVTGYKAKMVSYTCRCGHAGQMSLADGQRISGKLVWKVDWPMRWVFEGVDFEPAGEDHHAPVGSFTVGRELVKSLYGGAEPASTVYAFVGLAGEDGKMSGSAGGSVTPAAMLQVLEPALMRWLYARRPPGQSFSIDLAPRAVQRLYDEWDQFCERSALDGADLVERRVRSLCLSTSAGPVATSERPVSFRLLGSAADITQANRQQIARIVAQHLDDEVQGIDAQTLIAQLQPRLDCAVTWATRLLPAEERTSVNTEFNAAVWEELDEETRHGIRLLAAGLADNWDLASLTALVYGVPKQLLGLEKDATTTPELKKFQREFFKAVYRLLCSTETGPRLPTLLLSIGREHAYNLLVDEMKDPVMRS